MTSHQQHSKLDYPTVRRSDVADMLHGQRIADPYRWLEDADSAETGQFISQQSALTEAYLAAIPTRDAIRQRVGKLLKYERAYGMQEKAGQFIHWHHDGERNQPLLYSRDSVDGQKNLLLDPNLLSEDGTVAVTATALSDDGNLLAYVVSEGGSDWQDIHKRDLRTGADLDDVLTLCRFPQIAWHPDGSGIFYNGHLETKDKISAETNKNNKLFWHKIGTAQSADQIIFDLPDEPEWNLPPKRTNDDAFIISHAWFGAINRNRIYIRALDADGPLDALIANASADFRYVHNDGRRFFFRTDLNAPNYRIIAIDLDNPDQDQWQTVVAEREESLSAATIAGSNIIGVYSHEAHHVVRKFSLDGDHLGDVPLPAIGSILSLSGSPKSSLLFFDFHSFLFPVTGLYHDMLTDETQPWQATKPDFDTSAFETVLEYARSADGTKVPVFITKHKTTVLNGSNPTILYGYGGFSVNLTPRFSSTRLQWLEMGGVFAQAVLRGGAEFGESWHQAGMLANKQNVFDDFIASAEMLCQKQYCRPATLAIQGGSNGGLLVAACMLQRPELFGAVICQVPVIDMLRYHLFTAGRYWVPEYGDPDDPDEFGFMLAYSPLHNVEEQVAYPPALILTANKDDRVVPMHAHKFAATLQHANPNGAPALLRFELDAGHGFGKSLTKIINEAADIHAFLMTTLDATFAIP